LKTKVKRNLFNFGTENMFKDSDSREPSLHQLLSQHLRFNSETQRELFQENPVLLSAFKKTAKSSLTNFKASKFLQKIPILKCRS